MVNMKKLMSFITRLFLRSKGRSSLFADAWEEGIRDTLKEMGYKPDNRVQKVKGDNG